MNYWQRSCRLSKVDVVRKERIREIMNVGGSISDRVERMNEGRWRIKVAR